VLLRGNDFSGAILSNPEREEKPKKGTVTYFAVLVGFSKGFREIGDCPFFSQGPISPGGEVKRVVRGGHYFNSAADCRSAARDAVEEELSEGQNIGFRLIREP
jgi:hypothetical protein